MWFITCMRYEISVATEGVPGQYVCIRQREKGYYKLPVVNNKWASKVGDYLERLAESRC